MSARLRVVASDVLLPCSLVVVGFVRDSAPVVSSYADWQARPRTAASVSWDPTDWVRNQWASSPDLAPIVQEIVGRPGWAPGGGLGLSVGSAAGNAGFAVAFERDQSASHAAELVIDVP